MEEILHKILNKIDCMDKKITAMDDKISTMDNKISTMDDKISTMQLEITDIKVDVKGLKENYTKMNDTLDAIYNQTAELTEWKGSAEEKLTKICDDTNFIKHKLTETEQDVFNIKDHLKIIK